MNHWLTVELSRHRDDLKKAKLKNKTIFKITGKRYQGYTWQGNRIYRFTVGKFVKQTSTHKN